MVLSNRKIAEAVRRETKQATLRDQVLEDYLSQQPEYRAEMDRLDRQGLDPMAWLNVVSVPGAFALDCNTTSGKALSEVFKQCELDPSKPRHWRILLDAFVSQCFREAGAPQKWGEEGLFDLLTDIREVQKRFPDKKGKAQIAEVLSRIEPYKTKYSKASGRFTNKPDGALRKLVGKALNPDVNPSARISEEEDFIAARAERAARELGLPSELGIAVQTKTLERYFLDLAREQLRERHLAVGMEFTDDDWVKYLPAVRKLVNAQVKWSRNQKSD